MDGKITGWVEERELRGDRRGDRDFAHRLGRRGEGHRPRLCRDSQLAPPGLKILTMIG
ncbi:MAG: hypothetical protein IT503_03885 [Burkholderiaceae bacterium]|nr:hypothetical protein [Burkholderiaceae bacterium]